LVLKNKDENKVKLTVVYDNDARDGFISGWGFSCLIETKQNTILFDTGWDPEVLLYNLTKLNIQPEMIDMVVLSHQHWDHTGGLSVLLSRNHDIEVYVPTSFSRQLKNEISQRAELTEIDRSKHIAPYVSTTGELGSRIKEQSLVLDTDSGLYIITGCSHPGLASIMNAASRFGKVTGLIGGLHGSREYDLLKGLTLIASCHCTKYKKEIARRFKDTFMSVGAGWSLLLDTTKPVVK
jgi:7,8-dihydropterin-6-yl-methyl-4-(beta-D-ribofuranosyl)aminobenzene 5'-phosphate synthase